MISLILNSVHQVEFSRMLNSSVCQSMLLRSLKPLVFCGMGFVGVGVTVFFIIIFNFYYFFILFCFSFSCLVGVWGGVGLFREGFCLSIVGDFFFLTIMIMFHILYTILT